MDHIVMHPIGVIHSPYQTCKDIPIQGTFKEEGEAWTELDEQYKDGLKDLDQFSHAILVYYFHRSQKEVVEGTPYLEDSAHGIFAIRSPHRPNHIGMSIGKILRIEGNKVYFAEADMLDGSLSSISNPT